jgi:hypothetical protein
MIHRIASGCSLNKEKNVIIYMGFDLKEDMKEYYRENINKMLELTNYKIDISLRNIKIIKKKIQLELEKEWASGNRDLSIQVKQGIIENTLMEFEELFEQD